MKKHLNNRGFTNIELIIVLVILILLSGILVFAYKGVEARNHNNERMTAVNALQKHLEAFYQDNNYYPSLRDMNDTAWLNANLKSLDLSLLKDPTGNTLSLSREPVANQYAYNPTTENGQPCEEDDSQCAAYELTATLEGAEAYSKQNSN